MIWRTNDVSAFVSSNINISDKVIKYEIVTYRVIMNKLYCSKERVHLLYCILIHVLRNIGIVFLGFLLFI